MGWPKNIKGLTANGKDPDSGIFFEVQFHTHASWEAKQVTHPAYVKLADHKNFARRKGGAQPVFSGALQPSIPIPPGALEIPHYRKEAS